MSFVEGGAMGLRGYFETVIGGGRKDDDPLVVAVL